ncbi:MAG: hypothetical protein LBQ12_10575 [Deltaproteobacteria bacterium]|nr:hypothetical protein [Deltaproteobacteria bacterium]
MAPKGASSRQWSVIFPLAWEKSVPKGSPGAFGSWRRFKADLPPAGWNNLAIICAATAFAFGGLNLTTVRLSMKPSPLTACRVSSLAPTVVASRVLMSRAPADKSSAAPTMTLARAPRSFPTRRGGASLP